VSDSLPPDSPVERPMPLVAALLWAVALILVEGLAVQITEAVRPGAQTDIVNLAACQVLGTSLVLFAMARFHASELPLRGVLGARAIAPLRALLSIAAGAGLFPLMSTIDGAVLRRWPIQDDSAAESVQKLLASSSRTGLVIAALVVVPIARELFFRGVLYGGVRATVNARAAIVATSVLYACSFLDPQQMPTALAMGLALAWLRERSGTVFAPILAQLAYGAVEGIPILRGQDLEADVVYPVRWIAGGAVIAVLALVGIGASRRDSRDV
jgi:membrane protease YdiL (CAAX protease family)